MMSHSPYPRPDATLKWHGGPKTLVIVHALLNKLRESSCVAQGGTWQIVDLSMRRPSESRL